MAEVKATIQTTGDAFVVTAGFKYETVQNLIKYGKEKALALVDEKTKEPYFGVNLGDHTEISKYGITFTGANRNGYAECTGCFPEASWSDEEKKDFLRDRLAYVVTYLNEVQKQVEAEEKTLKAIIATVDAAITIA